MARRPLKHYVAMLFCHPKICHQRLLAMRHHLFCECHQPSKTETVMRLTWEAHWVLHDALAKDPREAVRLATHPNAQFANQPCLNPLEDHNQPAQLCRVQERMESCDEREAQPCHYRRVSNMDRLGLHLSPNGPYKNLSGRTPRERFDPLANSSLSLGAERMVES
jgi:hypothetical protein